MPEERITIDGQSFVRIARVGVVEDHPAGEGEGSGDKYFEFTQNSPSDVWGPIEHNLGKFPSYGARNSAGDYMDVGIIHHDTNTATLTLATADSGKAWFN